MPYASRATWGGLLAAGVEIWEWPDRVLHAKTALVDDVWFTCGSFNLDHRSLVHNLELNVSVVDAAVGRSARDMFERDLSAAEPVDAARWARRGLGQRLLERLCYGFRYWL